MLTRSLGVALWATAFLAPLLFAATPDASAATRTAKGSLPLQIQGRAFTPAGPLVNATVTGFAGALPAETTTNATGDFTLNLGFADVESLARLSVRGTGAQSHVEFVTVPGPYGQLESKAGDGTLDRSEDPYVDLTPYTTGVYLAMSAIVPLTNQTNWYRAFRSFVTLDAVHRAAILAGLADNLAPLPATTNTTLEGASQLAGAQATQDALFTFDGTCRTPAVCNMEAQLFSPPMLPVFPAPLLDTEFRGYAPFEMDNANGFASLQLNTGGTGTVLMANGGAGVNHALNVPTAIEWAPVGNTLRVNRSDDSPLAIIDRQIVWPCGGTGGVRTVIETLALRLRYLVGPAGSVLVQVGREERITYPNTPACTTVNNAGDPTFYSRVVGSSDVPLPPPDPTGKVILLPVCETGCASPPTHDGALQNRAVEPHQFNPGGTGTQLRLGRSFTWLNTEGRLQVTYSNGHSAEFTRVSDEQTAAGTVIAKYTDSTATDFITSGPIVEKDPAASFGSNASSAAGSFDTTVNREYPYATIRTEQRAPFGFKFFVDGTGTRLDDTGFIRWYLEGGGNRIRHERFANSTSVNLQQRRLWELIRVDGDEFLVLENSNATPPTPLTYTPTPRLFAYTRTTIPSAGSAPEPAEVVVAPGNAGDGTGSAVALGGEFIVIGAPDAAVSGVDAGLVYVFRAPTAAAAAAAAAAVVGKDGLARFASNSTLELVATLSSPTPTIGDKWGTSVTISPTGDSIAIGSPGTDGTGEVAVFEMPPAGWTTDSTPDVLLTPPTVVSGEVEFFGASLAMTDTGTLAVGAPGTDLGIMEDAGFAAVYTRDGTGFDTPQQILPVDGQDGAGFGTVVAASDSLLAIGAPLQDGISGEQDIGSVYAYTTPTAGTSYSLSATLSISTTGSIGDKFGSAVDVSGGTLLVGAPGTDTSRGPDTGSGFIYEAAGLTVPTVPSTQLLPQGVEGDGSGMSVSLIDGVAVLGAPLATRDGEFASGTTFYFRRPGTTWAATEELVSEREVLPTRPQTNQYFGSALALSQDLLIAGAPDRDLLSEEGQGEVEAIVFDRIHGSGFE